MSAAELLVDLQHHGFVLVAEEGNIRIAPSSRLTADLRAAIRAHKSTLVKLLRQQSATTVRSTAAVRPRATPSPLPSGRVFVTRTSGRIELCHGQALPPDAVLWCREGDPAWTPVPARSARAP